jgi:hypothetical protein
MSHPPYPPHHGQRPYPAQHAQRPVVEQPGQPSNRAPHGRPPYDQPHYAPQHDQHQYDQHQGTAQHEQRAYAPPSPPAPPASGRQQPAVPAPRRRKKWPWVLGVVVALFVIIGLTNGGGQQTPASSAAAPTAAAVPTAEQPVPAAPAAPAESGADQITYEVIGDGVSTANNITYIKDSNFGQQQENAESLPWSKTIEFENGVFDAQPLSLVAQSGAGGDGSITCRILRNGEEVTSSTSSGPYAVVTCSGGI